MKILVTGGAGFIGSALIRYLINETTHSVMNVDKLTYAASLMSLDAVSADERYTFKQIDICSAEAMQALFNSYAPDLVMHLAAESHVDRSIHNPKEFINTNILGTYILLETALSYWRSLSTALQKTFRFHHISTDEVYGDLEGSDNFFTENTAYQPSSPYSASKASADHLVRAWCRTYGLPTIITNCSNNYGPFQFPEKLIPLTISNALEGKPIQIYGSGKQIRDWLYVDDHARALYLVASQGAVGETYNIGGHNEKTNLEVILTLCTLLEEQVPIKSSRFTAYRDLITYTADRPGHDQRYAIDATKIYNNLNWRPLETFESGIRKTVAWYVSHSSWVNHIRDRQQNLSNKFALGQVDSYFKTLSTPMCHDLSAVSMVPADKPRDVDSGKF